MKKLKKILSLLTLIVVVGSEVLTSFSYALNDIVENSDVIEAERIDEDEEEEENIEESDSSVDEVIEDETPYNEMDEDSSNEEVGQEIQGNEDSEGSVIKSEKEENDESGDEENFQYENMKQEKEDSEENMGENVIDETQNNEILTGIQNGDENIGNVDENVLDGQEKDEENMENMADIDEKKEEKSQGESTVLIPEGQEGGGITDKISEDFEKIIENFGYFFKKEGDSRYIKYGKDKNNIGTITLKDPKTSFSITIMDKNLGANVVGIGNGSYGYYFQWGNNHGVESVISTNKTAQKAVYNDSYYNHGYNGKGEFIVGSSDYWENGEHYNSLWGNESKESSRYGACPVGYHIPTIKEWNQLLDIWGKIHTQDTSTSETVLRYSADYATRNIHTFKGAVTQCVQGDKECVDEDKLSIIIEILSLELKLPLAGSYDENGNFHDGLGVYWTSIAKDGNKAGVFDMNTYIGDGTDGALMYKSQGHNIRCFQNLEPYEAPVNPEIQNDESSNNDTSIDSSDDELTSKLQTGSGVDSQQNGVNFDESQNDEENTQDSYPESGIPSDIEPDLIIQDTTGDIENYEIDAKEYTITWKNEDGSIRDTSKVAYGQMPTHEDPVQPSDEKYSYKFAGWEPELEKVEGDAEYKAKYMYIPMEYTITWKNEDGTVIDTSKVAYGQMPTHANPIQPADEKYSYKFAGWEPKLSEVKGNAEYRAKYEYILNKYTITRENEDGTIIDTTEVVYGQIPTHEDPHQPADEKYSYEFAGWNSEITEVTGPGEYRATYKYITNKYTVTRENEDGTILKTQEVEYGTTPIYSGATPTKESSENFEYIFTGWEPEIEEIKGDVVYTAKYIESPIIQNEESNDGNEVQTGSLEQISQDDGQNIQDLQPESQNNENVPSWMQGDENGGIYGGSSDTDEESSTNASEGKNTIQEGENSEEEQGFFEGLWETLKSFFLNDEDGYLRGSETINDIVVSIEAETGTFPAGTEVVIKGVSDERLESIQTSLVEDESNNVTEDAQILAFDISFVYSGEEIQPEKEVSVKFNYQENSDFQGAKASELSVYHIDDDTDEGTEIGVVNKDGEEVEILATDFSVYVLALTRGDPDDDGTIAITFELNGGFWYDGFGGSRVVYVESGEDIAATRPSKDPYKRNYMFMGWFDESSNSEYRYKFQGTTITGDLTLTAHWAPFNDIVYTGIINGEEKMVILMDRNMGATMTGAGETYSTDSYGFYYQWGNNYGFYYDKPTKTINTKTGTKYVNNSYGPNNWFYGEDFATGSAILQTSNTNLWGGGGDNADNNYDNGHKKYTRQGPCPKGYHVPSEGEWRKLIRLFMNNNYPNHTATAELSGSWKSKIGVNGGDYVITAAIRENIANTFYFPTAGRVMNNYDWNRQAGETNKDGARAPFWSSSPYSNPKMIGFEVKFKDNKFNLGGWADDPTQGKAVRCFKDIEDYTVTWKDGDTILETDYYVYEGATPSYDEPEDPTKDGYEFTGWYLEGDENQTVINISEQIVTSNRTYVAKFISIAPEDAYQVTVDIEPSSGGSVQKNSRYNSGDIVTLTGIANSGFEFLGWFTGDNIISLDNPYVFTAYGSGGTGFTAVFSSLYNIYTGTNNELGGSVSYEVIDITRQGKIIRFTASPTEDFELDKWIVNGDEVSTGGSTQLDVILSGDISLTGYFVQVRNRLPCEFDGQTIAHGETVTGYQSDSVTCPNSCVSQVATCNNGEWSVNDFEAEYSHSSCTYSGFTCDAIEYPLSSCPENGICSSCTGYIVDDNACSQTNPIYKLNSCSGHYHVNGNVCEIDSYTVTIVSNNLEYGTVTQSSVTGAYGSTITINNNTVTISGTTVTATEVGSGSFVERLSLCGDTITGNCTIEAIFRGDQYLVSFNADRGTFVNGPISQSIVDGALVTPLTEEQKPKFPGYRVVGWYKTNPRLDNNAEEWIFDQDEVTGDITLYARWTNSYDVRDLDIYFVVDDGTGSYYTIMDRDVGASGIGAAGYQYQWGNNYGFQACTTKDCSTFPRGETTNPNQVDVSSYDPINNPYSSAIYITQVSKTANWAGGNVNRRDNLWGGLSGTNAAMQGPCPEGYHVPTRGDWKNIHTSRSGINFGRDGCENGSLKTCAVKMVEDLLLVTNGRRDHEAKVGFLDAASYWSSSPVASASTAYGLYLNDAETTDSNAVQIPNIDGRVRARSVRCVKNNYNTPLTININGGSKASVSVYDGELHYLTNPTKTGFEFGGWYTNSGFTTKIEDGSRISSRTSTLYAKWIVEGEVEYTFNANGGIFVVDDEETEHYVITSQSGDTFDSSSIIEPTRGCNTFDGWYDAASGGNLISFPDTVSNPITAYAHWTVGNCLVVWKYKNGSGEDVVETGNYSYGSMPSHENPPNYETVSTGYEFGGWTPGLTLVTGPAEYNAIYLGTPRMYEIIFEISPGGSGTGISVPYGSQIVIEGNTVLIGGIPVITAQQTTGDAEFTYNFSGWNNTCGLTVTEPCSIVAEHTVTRNSYNVIWKYMTETGLQIETGSYLYGSMPNHSGNNYQTAQTGYVFRGWTPEIGLVTGDITYTAEYNETTRSYHITWTFRNSSGDWVTNSGNYAWGSEFNPFIPTYSESLETGYTFVRFEPELAIITEDTGYTAIYIEEPRPYTITFVSSDENYGTVSSTSVTEGYGTPILINNNTITISGTTVTATATGADAQYTYIFSGWTNTCGDTLTGNCIITANFDRTINEYTVLINSSDVNSGTVTTGSITVPYGTNISKSGNILEIGSETSTANPNSQTWQYDFEFVDWTDTCGATVITGCTVTANFQSLLRTYILDLVFGTGIETIYYKINGAGEFINTGITTTISGVEAGSTVYAYAEAKDGYTYSETSESNPWSVIVTGDNVFSPEATAGGVEYTVYHYVKRVGSGTYALIKTETGFGMTDEILTLSGLSKENEFPCSHYDRGSLTGTEDGPGEIVTQTTIKGDGSTKIYLYYTRNNRRVILSGDVHIESLEIDGNESTEAVRECGGEVPINAKPKPGYHFVRWDRDREETEGDENNGIPGEG